MILLRLTEQRLRVLIRDRVHFDLQMVTCRQVVAASFTLWYMVIHAGAEGGQIASGNVVGPGKLLELR